MNRSLHSAPRPAEPAVPRGDLSSPAKPDLRKMGALTAAAMGLLGAITTAHAESSVQMFGLVDVSAGQYQNAGEVKTKQVASGKLTTSYLGFKGTEELGGGLKAVFQFAHFFQADTGAAGRFNGDTFWARDAYVGLAGDFGQLTLGRNTNPFFVSTLIFNAWGDSFGFSPSIRQVLLGGAGMPRFLGDTGWSDSVLYKSPNFGGASFSLIANANDTSGGTGRNVGGNVVYFGGPFAATFAAQSVKNGDLFGAPAGFDGQTSYQFGASYAFGPAKLFGQFTQTKVKTAAALTDTKTKTYGLGAQITVGAGNINLQYGNSKADFGGAFDSTNKTLTVGYDYNLSKRTDVYALYMNDKTTGLETGNSFAAGVRHRF